MKVLSTKVYKLFIPNWFTYFLALKRDTRKCLLRFTKQFEIIAKELGSSCLCICQSNGIRISNPDTRPQIPIQNFKSRQWQANWPIVVSISTLRKGIVYCVVDNDLDHILQSRILKIFKHDIAVMYNIATYLFLHFYFEEWSSRKRVCGFFFVSLPYSFILLRAS